MTRRRTFSEVAFAADTNNADLPVEWARDVATQLLQWTWLAFDQLREQHFKGIDFSEPLSQLERDLARHHFLCLQQVFHAMTDGFCSFVPASEWPEMESLTSDQAKPPAYDFAFVHVEHRRWAWPIEAKVLPTSAALSKYVKEVRGKFITGIAAPLVGEAGLIGYLLSGTADAFLASLSSQLSVALEEVAEFPNRPHRTSTHSRQSSPTLRLHHMVMACH